MRNLHLVVGILHHTCHHAQVFKGLGSYSNLDLKEDLVVKVWSLAMISH